jgi:2-keto-4-pentenoate hydratase
MSAAAELVQARRSGRRLASLPDDLVPRDEDAAYAVQSEVMTLLGATIGGWKVGAANPTAAPSAAPLFAGLVAPSPATFAATPESFRAVEAELALRLARDLPARAAPYGEDEAWDAVAAIHVALELLDSRYVDRARMPAAALLADNLSNGGFTFGPAIAGWRSIDFGTVKASLLIDGETAKSAVGGNPAGHPRRLLAWLANHAASRGAALQSGQVVTTGSHTGITIAPLGARVVARFEGLGEAVLQLAAAR